MSTKKAKVLGQRTHSSHASSVVPSGPHQTTSSLLQLAQTNPSALAPTQVLQLQRAIGNRAVAQLFTRKSPLLPTSPIATTPIVQRLAKDAINYIRRKSLPVPTPRGRISRADVREYVRNRDNPSVDRIGLARAWNQDGMIDGHIPAVQPHPITIPKNAFPKGKKMKDLEDLSGWDSEDEDDLDLSSVISKKSKGRVTLVRGNGDEITCHLLSMVDVIRLGRQIVKRNSYDLLPFVAKVGPLYIEYNSPGTKDVYATPLEKVPKKNNTFKRAGEMAKYNYQNLTARLEEESKVNKKRKRSDDTEERKIKKRKLEGILAPFSGESEEELSHGQAETVAAISCDFMKGSGAMHYVEQMQRHIGQIENGFAPFFKRVNPYYVPAQKGGRKMVTTYTQGARKIRNEIRPFLRRRNTLIHTIARAHNSRSITQWGLVRIGTKVGDSSKMLQPSLNTIKAITDELEVKQNITVHYPLKQKRKSQTFGDRKGKGIQLYHVRDDEYTDVCPDKKKYFKKESKQRKDSDVEEEEI